MLVYCSSLSLSPSLSSLSAYGQTGSGKTFSITGGPERYEDRGIIPRAITMLFEEFAKRREATGATYNCYISYLELYNENGYDLLDSRRGGDAASSAVPKVTMLEDEDGNLHFHPATSEEEALNVTGSKKSVASLARKVVGHLESSNRTVFVFLNNIEGQNLRTDDCQELIARIASLKSVHLVATVDNASVAPLLWDQKTADRLNLHYHHVPTYCSYEDELMYQNDIAFEENDGRRLQAASVVLSSLTQTARAVFRELGESQIAEGGGDHARSDGDGGEGSASGTGMAFAELFASCREQLILSNEITLRSHLEEFLDHDLVCLSEIPDTRTALYKIPLRVADIERLMDLCL